MYYLFLADGFEETEALTPLDMMRRSKIDVKTVGVTGNYVTGSHNVTVKADIAPEQIVPEKTDGVILPGGMPGTINLEASKDVIETVKYCRDNDKLLCAICAAPSIFGHLGILKGRKATCFPGFETSFGGAEYTGAHTTVDGNIITAKGAGCAVEFGYEIVAKILSEEAAEKVAEAMQCR